MEKIVHSDSCTRIKPASHLTAWDSTPQFPVTPEEGGHGIT